MKYRISVVIVTLCISSAAIAGPFHWKPVGARSSMGACKPFNFNYPDAVAVGNRGTIYIGNEQGPNAIQAITVHGNLKTLLRRKISDGRPVNLRGLSIAVGRRDDIYFAVKRSGVVYRLFRTGRLHLVAGKPGVNKYINGSKRTARLDAPNSIAVGPRGNIFVADAQTVREITKHGTVITVAGVRNSRLTYGSTRWPIRNGKGIESTFFSATDIVVDGAGTIYVADNYTGPLEQQVANFGVVRKIRDDGVVSTLAGALDMTSGSFDGVGDNANFNSIVAMSPDPRGGLFLVSDDRRLRHVSRSGRVVTIYRPKNNEFSQHNVTSPSAMAVSRGGAIYIANSFPPHYFKVSNGPFWLNRFKSGRMAVLCKQTD